MLLLWLRSQTPLFTLVQFVCRTRLPGCAFMSASLTSPHFTFFFSVKSYDGGIVGSSTAGGTPNPPKEGKWLTQVVLLFLLCALRQLWMPQELQFCHFSLLFLSSWLFLCHVAFEALTCCCSFALQTIIQTRRGEVSMTKKILIVLVHCLLWLTQTLFPPWLFHCSISIILHCWLLISLLSAPVIYFYDLPCSNYVLVFSFGVSFCSSTCAFWLLLCSLPLLIHSFIVSVCPLFPLHILHFCSVALLYDSMFCLLIVTKCHRSLFVAIDLLCNHPPNTLGSSKMIYIQTWEKSSRQLIPLPNWKYRNKKAQSVLLHR